MKDMMKLIRKLKDLFKAQKEKKRLAGFAERSSILFNMVCKKGVNIIILSSDCTGGRLMNDYRMSVNTPTVNYWCSASDFLTICENPEKYFSTPILLDGQEDEDHFRCQLGDVVIHLGHEFNSEKAVKRWNRGCKQFLRAIKDPHEICVIMNDRNGFTDSDMVRFEALPYPYKVIFTHKPYANAPHAFYMKGEDHLPFVKIMTGFEHVFTVKRRYDRYDFYHEWFVKILS